MTPHRAARRASIAIVAVLATTSFLTGCGDDDDEPAATTEAAPEASVEITGAWARTSPSVASAGAVYLTITNTGDVDDTLLSAAVDPSVAATAELHETVAAATGEDRSSTTVMDGGMTTETTAMNGAATDTTAMGGGMMTMQPVDRIPVAAGDSVALEPGGYHVMLLDLASPLEVGSTVDVTLTFEESGEQVVTVEVRDMAP
jgi:copper(I)-binding protein